MKTAAIIAAAGIGRRMGFDLPKQYLEIGGRPIICHTLDKFLNAKCIDHVIIAVELGRDKAFIQEILIPYKYPKSWQVISGGRVRQESVANALELVSDEFDVVLIHDGVRPFVTVEQIERSVNEAAHAGACIVAAPVKDTIKRVGEKGFIQETVDRQMLWSAQTPQCFLTSLIKEAFTSATKDGFVGTDDASLVERLDINVSIIEGTSHNIKITTPSDLTIAEAILKQVCHSCESRNPEKSPFIPLLQRGNK